MTRPTILKTVLDIFFVLLIIKIVLRMMMDSFRYFSGLPINYFSSAEENTKVAGDNVGLVVANICILKIENELTV